jgi:hypothetical protein
LEKVLEDFWVELVVSHPFGNGAFARVFFASSRDGGADGRVVAACDPNRLGNVAVCVGFGLEEGELPGERRCVDPVEAGGAEVNGASGGGTNTGRIGLE